MSPANIEATLKGSSPLIGQACVIGDGRRYNTALLVLDPDVAPAWAARQGIEGDLAALARDERVVAAVQEAVDAANATLSRPEAIKRFTLVEGDWLPGGDELTPTMKLKRRPVEAKYADADRGDVRDEVNGRPRNVAAAGRRRACWPPRRPPDHGGSSPSGSGG